MSITSLLDAQLIQFLMSGNPLKGLLGPLYMALIVFDSFLTYQDANLSQADLYIFNLDLESTQ